jgi:hypothetical protein
MATYVIARLNERTNEYEQVGRATGTAPQAALEGWMSRHGGTEPGRYGVRREDSADPWTPLVIENTGKVVPD